MRLTPDFSAQTQVDHWETQMPCVSDQAQLEAFATDLTQIFSLETDGRLSPKQAYSQIKTLMTKLKTQVVGD